MPMILCAAFSSDLVMARRTLMTSLVVGQRQMCLYNSHVNIPASVLGWARVTSRVHCSQQTSSSALLKKYDVFFRFFSKNCTTICPLPRGWCVLSIARTSANVFCSMSVSRSTSSMAGRVRSRRSRVKGEMEVKYRWKNIVCSIAGARSTMVHGAIRAGRRVVG